MPLVIQQRITPATRKRIYRLLGRWYSAHDRNRIIRLATLANIPVHVRRLHLGGLDGELYGEVEVFGR